MHQLASERAQLTRVSPELAMVDPELGRRLRQRLRIRPVHSRPPLPVLRLAPAGDTPMTGELPEQPRR